MENFNYTVIRNHLDNEGDCAFIKKLIDMKPENRSIMIIKPHAFEDEFFTMNVVEDVKSMDYSVGITSRRLKSREDVDQLYSILTVDDHENGNDWKESVYEEFINRPSLAIGLIGIGAARWSFEYKYKIRDIFCDCDLDKKRTARNFIHTPDDVGGGNPGEFRIASEIFFGGQDI